MVSLRNTGRSCMNLDTLTDEELMEMYQNGSELAFKALYERHSSKIHRFLQSRVKQKEKVADIYQGVFVKIHKSKHLYNKTFSLLPWIFTITRSVMLDELRKDKGLSIADDFNMQLISSTTENISESKTDQAIAMMKHLPDSQKLAIQLRYIDDKTFEEIAESLKTSSTNVRQIISRGVKRLRELMSEGGS